MQRILLALVALTSFLMVNLRPTQAQTRAVEPTAAPQQIDEPADGGVKKQTAAAPDGHRQEMREVKAGQTVDAVQVRDQPFLLAGHVKKNVITVNSRVTIKPGARVDGSVVAIGGSVDNEAGDAVHVIKESPQVLSLFEHRPQSNAVTTRTVYVNRDSAPEENWAGGQFGLLVLGLLGGLILKVLAPRATGEVADTVGQAPGRSLAVGGIAALGLLAVLALNAGLMQTHTIFSLIWAPFGFLIAIVPLLLLIFGWLCGMRHVGDAIACRLGRSHSGGLYGRMALGLGAFFLLNTLLGGMSRGLGVAGLLLEFAIAIMGLGAVIVTGKDSDWLGSRLSWGRRF
jgi:hypothetical protein